MSQIRTKILHLFILFFVFSTIVSGCSDTHSGSGFSTDSGEHISGWVQKHGSKFRSDPDNCIECHGDEEANAVINFSALTNASTNYDLWESAVGLINDGIMPPADEPQPTQKERKSLNDWYQKLIADVEPHPGYFRPRRLSAHEYRNTLHSLFGFELNVALTR